MRTFKTKREVNEYLTAIFGPAKLDGTFAIAGDYVHKHGEVCRPHYKPKQYADGWGVYVKHWYMRGRFARPNSGRVDPDTLQAGQP